MVSLLFEKLVSIFIILIFFDRDASIEFVTRFEIDLLNSSSEALIKTRSIFVSLNSNFIYL